MTNELDKLLGAYSPLHLTGAYGRKASRADWDCGKDFQIVTQQGFGPYTSCRDVLRMRHDGYTHLRFLDKDGSLLWAQEL